MKSEEQADRDIPISTDKFLRHVRTFKALLGPALLASISLEIYHVIDWIRTEQGPLVFERDIVLWEGISDCVGLGLISISIITYIYSCIYSIKGSEKDHLPNLGVHRLLCQITFFIILLLLVGHAIPAIAYTILTRHSAPIIHRYPWLDTARTISLTCTLFASGLMRRGPKLHYTPISLGTGFGINAATNVVPGGNAIKGGYKPGDSDIEMQPSYDTEGDKFNVLDYANTSMLSFIFLTYMAKTLRRSMAVEQLQPSDLPHLEGYNRDAGADQDLRSSFTRTQGIELPTREGKITKWMLVKNLWAGRGMTVFITFCVETLVQCFSYVQIYSMHEIITAFDQARKGGEDNYAYARLMCWGLFVGQTTECILSAYSWSRENYLIHTPVKMSLASLLFRKILRTTDVKTVEAHNLSEAETQAGKGRSQMINLLTIDSHTMASLATHLWNASNSMIALVIGVVFLYQMFGVSALIGIFAFLLSAPLSVYVSKQSYIADRAWARARDARASAIKEFLLCYKVIKLNAFEPYFRRRIERLRNFEVYWQRWRFTLGTIFNVLADQLPNLAIFVIFLFYTKVFGYPLEPASAFVALSVFDRVKSGLQFIPRFIQELSGTIVALNRLVAFLNRPEVDLDEWEQEETEIVFEKATFSWPLPDVDDYDPAAFKLKDVDFKVPTGKFTLVCGPLGSGKSLLLRSLLGESHLDSGSMRAPRTELDSTPINGYAIPGPFNMDTWLDNSVSYAPQQAYIRHGTIRDNILFGQPMWRSRYKEALREASLLSDLGTFADGDLTEVGDHGVNLSGGQKARVNLARCLYSRSRTVYLDDILSAVDAHTAQFIIEECFAGPLLKGRTVIVVSHHVALCLPVTDFVISLRDGLVEQACPVSEARMEVLESLEPHSPVEEITSPKINGHLQLHAHDSTEDDAPPETTDDRTTRQVYKAEHSSVGRVATNHYMLVFRAAGGKFYWIVFALILGSSVVINQVYTPLLFRKWSGSSDPSELNSYLLTYLFLTTSGILIGGLRWMWLYGIGNVGFYNRGSKAIHVMLLDVICTAPLRFFEETPKGRIMNIFGGDMYRLDGNSADDFGRTVMAALFVGASALMVCFQAPALLTILVIFSLPLYWLSYVLGKLRADLRRLTSVANSPLVTLYSDAIDGIVMIRAFGSSKVMLAAMQILMNREREAWVADFLVYNWVRGLIRAMASVFVTATGFVLLGSDMSGAQVGFILLFALNASQGLFNLLECYSNLEQTFVSAERINHYVKMDMAETTDGIVPEKSWPDQGSIKFNNLSVKYAEDLPEVLHDVSFEVQPGMRVGLVGSTGSGKSTLALTLFRAIEAHRGSIEIDGHDIKSIKLDELRGRLNMVVQEGTLCSGTLRDALDITGAIDDHEIYEALRRVHLIPDNASPAELASNPFANLDTFVAVEGANFSHGQRQLLCLARALLKPGKILVMDEATSSVDFEMDALITETIKECFKGRTMIVIAHRLATIMHYDRVLVLDKGEVKEYGSPSGLIQDERSAFYGLCMAQGEEEFEKLSAMVR